eukprot:4215884-Amphidinium_carterae.1
MNNFVFQGFPFPARLFGLESCNDVPGPEGCDLSKSRAREKVLTNTDKTPRVLFCYPCAQ